LTDLAAQRIETARLLAALILRKAAEIKLNMSKIGPN
jgi:hypothetical protein